MANIKDIIANHSKKQVDTEKRLEFKVQMIHYTKLNPSKNNFYSTTEIEDLADLLLLSGGIKQNLLVRKIDFGEYEIIAGHKRRLAAMYNVERGYKEYEFLPCKEENVEDLLAEYQLIITNSSQRERSHFEKMQEVVRLKAILPFLLGNEELKGRALRKVLEQETKLGAGTIAAYENISNNLGDKAMEKFKNGSIGVSVANELAGLEEEKQEEVLEQFRDGVTIKDVKEAKESKEIKRELNKAEKELVLEIVAAETEKVIDILLYCKSKSDKVGSLKNLFGNRGGATRNGSYNFSYSGKIMLHAQAFDPRALNWSEFVDELENLSHEGKLISNLSISELTDKEEQIVFANFKKAMDNGFLQKNELRVFYDTYTGLEDFEEKSVLLHEFLFRGNHNCLERFEFDCKLKIHHDISKQIEFYKRANDEIPHKMITWQQAAELVDKAIKSKWLTVSDSDTKNIEKVLDTKSNQVINTSDNKKIKLDFTEWLIKVSGKAQHSLIAEIVNRSEGKADITNRISVWIMNTTKEYKDYLLRCEDDCK